MCSRAIQSMCAKGELGQAVDLLCSTPTPLPPNTYLSLLKACKTHKSQALHHAQQVRSHIAHHNVPLSGLLGDYLVVTLSMCGAVDDALLASRGLHHRSVFSWTAIISGYLEAGRPREALGTYQSMLQDGVEPNHLTLVALLRASGDLGDLDQGRDLHAYACIKGFASDATVGHAIMSMYLHCGAIADAEHVFMALQDHTLLSMNSMLFAWADHGEGEKALQFYEQMQVEPNHHTLISVFKVCGTIKDLKQGIRLHAHAREKGLLSDMTVISALMSMYGKCGVICESEDLFVESPDRDVVLWNTMLSIYVDQRQGERALQLYRQMQEEGVNPTERTMVFAVRACTLLAEIEEIAPGRFVKAMSFEIGQALHADACKKYFQYDAFLYSTLVNMYGKCGAISEAEELFCASLERDLVLWNAMLSAYAEHGQGVKALCLFCEMEKQSRIPDQPTFVTVLHAVSLLREEEEPLSEGRFSRVMSLEIGFALHGSACVYTLASDTIVGSALVSMYGRAGALPEAEHTFCTLSLEMVVPWNAMLSAYVEQNQGQRAMQLYRQLQMAGPSPDEITFTLLLQACGTMVEQEGSSHEEGMSPKLLALKLVQALHVDAYRTRFPYDVSIGNTLVSLYGKCGAILEAEDVFSSLPYRTVVSWNAMLSVYIEHSQGGKVLGLYTQMHRESLCPDPLTFVCALQACSDLADKEGDDFFNGKSAKIVSLEIGRALHSDCDTQGYASYAFIRNTLVRMYGKCGAIKEAEDLSGFLSPGNDKRRDHECGSLYDTFITQSGKSCAVKLQNEWLSFPLQDVVSYNAMLLAYAEQGHLYNALQLYNHMQTCGLFVNLLSVTRMLQACSAEGSLEICLQLHFAVISAGYDWVSSTGTTLIHAYGSCADVEDADAFLATLPEPDIIAWNACISGYAGEGNSSQSLFMLDELILMGIEPNDGTFLPILSACCQTGLVPVGFHYFESMREKYSILPDSKHYCSLLDLLGRAGDFKRTMDMLQRSPIESSLITWLSLLGACCSHGNAAIAKIAYDHAVYLQPHQATAYVLMSNICADVELLKDDEHMCL